MVASPRMEYLYCRRGRHLFISLVRFASFFLPFYFQQPITLLKHHGNVWSNWKEW